MAKKRIEVTDVNYNQKHLIDIDENDIPSPSADIDPEKLASVLQGSDTVVVDLSEDNEHVEVHLDADVVAKVDNSMQLPVAPPLETALVGVTHAGSQTMVGVGDGLEIVNGVLKAKTIHDFSNLPDTALLKDLFDFGAYYGTFIFFSRGSTIVLTGNINKIQAADIIDFYLIGKPNPPNNIKIIQFNETITSSTKTISDLIWDIAKDYKFPE